MFENFLVDPKLSNSKKKGKQLQRLLAKYIELQKFQEIKSNDNISAIQRQKLNKFKAKKRIFKEIHDGLNERLRPEETFEIWHSYKNLNVNLAKQKSAKKNGPQENGVLTNNIIKELETLDEGEIHEDDESDENELTADIQLSKFLNSFDLSSTWTKANFLIRTKGLEVLPHSPLESNSWNKGNIGLRGHHINNLKTLLHINILRRNWTLAYKIFCLLIRFPNVDIRSIWPLGIEILSRQREETAYNDASIKLFKDEKFFDWLSSFFIINKHNTVSNMSNSRQTSAPIWRSGSKTHTPIYVITSLWGLMIKNKYSKLKDKLEELLLEPPHNTDGVFYFLMALCKLLENIKLLNKFTNFEKHSLIEEDETEDESENTDDVFLNSRNDVRLKILENQKVIEVNLEKCKEFHFEYPKTLINNEINLIMRQLDHNYNDSVSSTSSDIEEDLGNEDPTFNRNISLEVEPIFEDARDQPGIDYSDSKSNTGDHREDIGSNYCENEANKRMDFDFDFE